MNNLILVLRWRDSPRGTAGGALHTLKVNNFCGDKDSHSCDAAFVIDVFAFHLGKEVVGDEGARDGPPRFSNLFSGFTKLIIVGDHGPHFASRRTVLNESRLKKLYGMEPYVLSLCSYHAYNR
jgi:hypothetical protein